MYVICSSNLITNIYCGNKEIRDGDNDKLLPTYLNTSTEYCNGVMGYY